MKKITLLLTLVFIIFSCCKKDNDVTNTCNVSNPVEDLTWLKEQIQELENTSSYESKETYILQTKHDGNSLFILGNCCAACNSVSTVYNCEGEMIGYIGDDTFNFNLIENSTIIWKAENSICF
ncbi:hypothetical protein EV196_1019 [Mariniflexile fucanivorans]|uniref:Uncharacterized protein n=1 Tax=Mariniflexile fucanivorans TaxID=264023 RepID=A0A4R1RQC6_9FLAO|nr:hypothetical protein [Mariniflexile fucanivorans]TCL68595.1 hypothetical protein EV196_1019 [Mariniflexile fucanivorans]